MSFGTALFYVHLIPQCAVHGPRRPSPIWSLKGRCWRASSRSATRKAVLHSQCPFPWCGRFWSLKAGYHGISLCMVQVDWFCPSLTVSYGLPGFQAAEIREDAAKHTAGGFAASTALGRWTVKVGVEHVRIIWWFVSSVRNSVSKKHFLDFLKAKKDYHEFLWGTIHAATVATCRLCHWVLCRDELQVRGVIHGDPLAMELTKYGGFLPRLIALVYAKVLADRLYRDI